jgi:hypothetical protein
MNDNQSPEEGNRANYRNVLHIKHISRSGNTERNFVINYVHFQTFQNTNRIQR